MTFLKGSREDVIGNIGEEIVKSKLRKRGWKLYINDPKNEGGHPFEFVAHGKLKDTSKYIFCYIEVKTKPRRYKYPDTGIDKWNHDKLLKLLNDNDLDTVVFFVDIGVKNPRYKEYAEFDKAVYGNKFSELIKPTKIKDIDYPRSHKTDQADIVYYPLANMKLYFKLTDEDLSQLSNTKSQSINEDKEREKINMSRIKHPEEIYLPVLIK